MTMLVLCHNVFRQHIITFKTVILIYTPYVKFGRWDRNPQHKECGRFLLNLVFHTVWFKQF